MVCPPARVGPSVAYGMGAGAENVRCSCPVNLSALVAFMMHRSFLWSPDGNFFERKELTRRSEENRSGKRVEPKKGKIGRKTRPARYRGFPRVPVDRGYLGWLITNATEIDVDTSYSRVDPDRKPDRGWTPQSKQLF